MTHTWVKVVLAISLDGKIALANGAKTQLGNSGDREVLEKALSWSDATLMGGETLRKHKNTCLIHSKKLIENRVNKDRSEQPISIIISNQKKYPVDFPYFKQPIIRWLIEPQKDLDSIENNYYDRLIDFKKNWEKTLKVLYENGIEKLLVLGGAKLIGSLLLEDQINELQLTITPKIIGGVYTWVPNNLKEIPEKLSLSDSWLLKETQTLTNNELMIRYFRNKF